MQRSYYLRHYLSQMLFSSRVSPTSLYNTLKWQQKCPAREMNPILSDKLVKRKRKQCKLETFRTPMSPA